MSIVLLVGLARGIAASEEGYAPPVGLLTVTIAAGTGATRTTSVLSVPLWMEARAAGAMVGRVTAVTNDALTNGDAGWTPGELSNPALPCVIKMTSGHAAGRAFLISTTVPNTPVKLTVDANERVDLTALGVVAGDSYRIYAADTLATLFPPGSGVLAGTGATTADNILLNFGGIWRTYFLNSTRNSWVQVTLGSPVSDNVAISPNAGLQFSRLAATPLQLVLMGEVPMGQRQVAVATQGVTFLANGWPVSSTLAASEIHRLSGWKTAANVADADTVQLLINGIWRKYFHDGAHWRQATLGNPNADAQVVSAGTVYLINRNGASGTAILTQHSPY